MRKSNPDTISLSKNKKAFHDYEILEAFEAGIVLTGEEVKSIRDSQMNLKGSYVEVTNETAFLNEAHVSRYKFSSSKEYNPTRRRKLLLHKKQTLKIDSAISQKGVTAIPLEVYLKKGLIKVSVGICRGKKLYDKRDSLKKRDQKRDIDSAIKELRD
jgi:SsrA-binding protein